MHDQVVVAVTSISTDTHYHLMCCMLTTARCKIRYAGDNFVTAGSLQGNMLMQRNAPEYWQGRHSFESHQAKHAAIRKIVRQLCKGLALQQQPL